MSGVLWRSIAVVAIATAVASCSSTSGGTGTDSTATAHRQAVRFAECMRTNGVAAFPDPEASGELTIDGIANGSSVDTGSAVFKQALDVCKNLEPAGFTGHRATPDQMKARLEFAQCVRDDGVPDFPDPTRDGALVDTTRIPSTATASGMTLLNAAMSTCGRRYGDRLGVSAP